MNKKNNIVIEIAWTYLITNKKMTGVAALGVTLGIAVFIFMNCMMAGFEVWSNEAVFRSSPHIRIYRDAETSRSLLPTTPTGNIPMIVNPKVVPESNTIINPFALVKMLRQQKDVTVVSPQITANVFYNNGKSQISGQAYGILSEEANQMFDIKSFMVEGNYDNLKAVPNGILIGVGIADKMSVRTGDNISLTSSKGITKVMKVVGLFQSNNSLVDKSKSYINLAFAQQLLKENNTYITDINVNITDFNQSKEAAQFYSQISNYKAEDWQTANETLVAGSRMRAIIIRAVSLAILLVAGFGIYNILNMTITQKINDIAILKAMGFKGKDVVKIFVTQALLIGVLGISVGLLLASLLIQRVSNMYVGGDIGFFPITFDAFQYVKGIVFGLVITFLAGFIPAQRAADVDPVAIFRK
jgi:lipoprotein-releasing system permease protein